MTPNINKGDVVVIKKIKDNNYESLKEGQVIAYKYENKIVIHRLERIIKTSSENFYYTKGDANKYEDNYVITESMIIGRVTIRIPLIGYPTIWINEI